DTAASWKARPAVSTPQITTCCPGNLEAGEPLVVHINTLRGEVRPHVRTGESSLAGTNSSVDLVRDHNPAQMRLGRYDHRPAGNREYPWCSPRRLGAARAASSLRHCLDISETAARLWRRLQVREPCPNPAERFALSETRERRTGTGPKPEKSVGVVIKRISLR